MNPYRTSSDTEFIFPSLNVYVNLYKNNVTKNYVLSGELLPGWLAESIDVSPTVGRRLIFSCKNIKVTLIERDDLEKLISDCWRGMWCVKLAYGLDYIKSLYSDSEQKFLSENSQALQPKN